MGTPLGSIREAKFAVSPQTVRTQGGQMGFSDSRINLMKLIACLLTIFAAVASAQTPADANKSRELAVARLNADLASLKRLPAIRGASSFSLRAWARETEPRQDRKSAGPSIALWRTSRLFAHRERCTLRPRRSVITWSFICQAANWNQTLCLS